MEILFPTRCYTGKANCLLEKIPKFYSARLLLWEIVTIKGFFSFFNTVINLSPCKAFQS